MGEYLKNIIKYAQGVRDNNIKKGQKEVAVYLFPSQTDQRVTEVMLHTYDYRNGCLNTP